LLQIEELVRQLLAVLLVERKLGVADSMSRLADAKQEEAQLTFMEVPDLVPFLDES
jgi:hypothetical protein